jgi:hypothetical protein
LLDATEALAAKDIDLLVLTGSRSNELLEHWAEHLAIVFRKLGRDYRELDRAPSAMTGPLQARRSNDAAAPHVVINADGSLAALLSFESPVSRGRTVIALVGNDAAAAESLVASLEDENRVSQIRGELALVRNDAIQSYQGGDLYYVGSLSWWQWLWFHFSRHALLLTIIALAAAVATGLFFYGWLQHLAAQRLSGRTGS